jgi:hypothetical protein
MVGLDSTLDSVDQREGHISGTAVVTGAELRGRDEGEVVDIQQKVLSHNFFQELTTAFQQADRPVCLQKRIIWLVWFGDYNYLCIFLWVMPQRECRIKEVHKLIGPGIKGPSEELVCDATGAWSRLV